MMSLLLLYKIISIQLAWLGSIAVYLTAKQQVFLKNPLPKRLAWTAFTVCTTVSVLLLCMLYHWLTASIFVLLVITLAWIILGLWSPHYNKPRVVFSVGTLLMLFTAILGGGYVV